MHAKQTLSLRGILSVLFALAVLAGGACVSFVGSRDDAAIARMGETEIRRVANLISDRLGEGLATVGRDLGLAAENVVFARDGNPASVQQFLDRWRAMYPNYADVLLADRSGRVLATASGAFAGADVSQTTWYSRGLSGIVIGDASERTRVGADIPRNVIVAAPVRAGGTTEIGVLAVQLAPDWIEESIAAMRRSFGGAARDAVIQVTNAGGRALHRSVGLAGDGTIHETSVAVGDGAGLGWLVSVKGRSRIEDGAVNGPLPLLALAASALMAAFVGGALGGRLDRDIAQICNAAHSDGADLLRDQAATADLAALADAVGACIGRSRGRERLLRESRAALARSRDRVRAVRLLGGFTCWEVDLRNGQVTWADGSADTVESATERACALEQVLMRVEADDRDQLKDMMRAVCEEPGSIREVVIRTLAGSEDAVSRRLVLRLTAVAQDGNPVRLHILSRELALAALPAPTTAYVSTSEARDEAAARRDGFPAQVVVAEIARDVGAAVEAVVAALDGIGGEAGAAPDSRIDAASRNAVRAGALMRRLAALVRPEEAPTSDADADGILVETATFIRSAILPGLVLITPEVDLPQAACSAREIEVALLNLASDARASLPVDATVSLTVRRVTPSPGKYGLRVVFSAPPEFQAGCGLVAIREAMDAIGGAVGIEAGAQATVLSLTFPAAPNGPARSDLKSGTMAVLLVEPDAVLRTSVMESLSGHGYAVTMAASAEEAAGVLAARRDFKVLLCAHTPHVLDGLHLAEVVSRTHPAIVTVLMAPATVQPASHAAVRTLCKPFGAQDLADALAAAIEPARHTEAA